MFLGRILEPKSFTAESDVCSFGVFLLELVSGTEASKLELAKSGQGITKWVINYIFFLGKYFYSVHVLSLLYGEGKRI